MATTAEKLVGSLAGRISAKIFAGEYPPGSRLRQEALAEEFSVSRTPIREALRQLEAKGVIQHVPNQGAIVLAPNARDIREAYQVRAELEGLAISLAVEWMTDEQIERMRNAQKRFAEAVDKLTRQLGPQTRKLISKTFRTGSNQTMNSTASSSRPAETGG